MTTVTPWTSLRLPRFSVRAAEFARRALLARLARIAGGELRLRYGSVEQRFGAPDPSGLSAHIEVVDSRFWLALALRGSVGAGEAYADGWWRSDNATDVVRLLLRNRNVLSKVDGGWSRLSKPFLQVFHALRDNTRAGSKRNIAAHYDLSNDFFALFLDPSLTYSCGYYESEESSLEESQHAKLERLCRKLELTPSDHLLEIGTGWGALAIHAAREYGCRVTTTTISEEQHSLAAERIRAAGLEDRITLLRQDYRDLEGRYDKLVSVEMIEAVGHRHLGTYLETCGRLLAPGGRFCLQAITLSDQHYDEARKRVDFVRRHIFPGSFIPSTTAILSSATESSALRLRHLEDIGAHYARTLEDWRANLHRNEAAMRELGLDDRFLRLWEFYFCYCSGGFAEGYLGDVQFVFERPMEWGS